MAKEITKEKEPACPELSMLAQQIVTTAIQRNLKRGARITELSLTSALSVSRTPVRKALRELSAHGFVEQIPNKGYYFRQNPEKIRFASEEALGGTIWLYKAIARDRIARQLPDAVQESSLMRRYNTTRGLLKKVLTQIAEEGWIEKGLGYGWRFLPMIDSRQTYRDSYELRVIIEPESILAPRFDWQSPDFASMLEVQRFIVAEGFETMGDKELVNSNAAFHECIATHSGNRFLHQSIQRINRLRMVLEMFQSVNRDRVRQHTEEHIHILERIMDNDLMAAAQAMSRHLQSALTIKLEDPLLARLFESR